MKLDGRRQSTNVDDRRSSSAGRTAGLGIGGMVILGLIIWATGGNPLQVLQYSGGIGSGAQTEYVETEEDKALMQFSSTIFAGTEDVWTALFKQMGKTYVPPKLVVFNGAVSSGCGNATSSTGPFYCSADQCVYLDLSFFKEMKSQFGTSGDFAWAYVIAHEVGHHVQNQLGTLRQVQQAQARASKVESNRLNVRLELQADFYAGIWAYYDNKFFGSLEEGDVDEGLSIASAIGDDRLQKQAQGYVVPESFNHGTSAQRSKWLKKGLTTGDVSLGDTYSPAYENL